VHRPLEERLHSLSVPVTAIYGEFDHVVHNSVCLIGLMWSSRFPLAVCACCGLWRG
jgi:hypothetical protein